MVVVLCCWFTTLAKDWSLLGANIGWLKPPFRQLGCCRCKLLFLRGGGGGFTLSTFFLLRVYSLSEEFKARFSVEIWSSIAAGGDTKIIECTLN